MDELESFVSHKHYDPQEQERLVTHTHDSIEQEKTQRDSVFVKEIKCVL